MEPDLNDYQQQQEANKQAFFTMMQTAIPDFHALAVLLDKTNVNPVVLFHVVGHIAEIARGTGFGQVNIDLENGNVMFVRGQHSTKIVEPAIKSLTEELTSD